MQEQKAESEVTPSGPSFQFRFRLIHLIYAMAVCAAAIAASQEVGVILGILIVGGWTLIFVVPASLGRFEFVLCVGIGIDDRSSVLVDQDSRRAVR